MKIKIGYGWITLNEYNVIMNKRMGYRIKIKNNAKNKKRENM